GRSAARESRLPPEITIGERHAARVITSGEVLIVVPAIARAISVTAVGTSVGAIRADIGVRTDHHGLCERGNSRGQQAHQRASRQCSSDDVCHFSASVPGSITSPAKYGRNGPTDAPLYERKRGS